MFAPIKGGKGNGKQTFGGAESCDWVAHIDLLIYCEAVVMFWQGKYTFEDAKVLLFYGEL
jgi:hypothetical protein